MFGKWIDRQHESIHVPSTPCTTTTSNNDSFESRQSMSVKWLGYIFNGVGINGQHRKIREPTTPASKYSSIIGPFEPNEPMRSEPGLNIQHDDNKLLKTLQYSWHNPILLWPADPNRSGAKPGTKSWEKQSTEHHGDGVAARQIDTNVVHRNKSAPPDLEWNYPFGF